MNNTISKEEKEREKIVHRFIFLLSSVLSASCSRCEGTFCASFNAGCTGRLAPSLRCQEVAGLIPRPGTVGVCSSGLWTRTNGWTDGWTRGWELRVRTWSSRPLCYFLSVRRMSCWVLKACWPASVPLTDVWTELVGFTHTDRWPRPKAGAQFAAAQLVADETIAHPSACPSICRPIHPSISQSAVSQWWYI